jgi:hypothetical protein
MQNVIILYYSFFYQYNFKYFLLLQWPPLNVIPVNVIIRLMLSNLQRPGRFPGRGEGLSGDHVGVGGGLVQR